MTISKDKECQILRLFHADKWPPGTIAAQVGVHHDVVERVLEQAGLPQKPIVRPSMADPYVPFMLDKLKEYPSLCASRLFQMVKERGYPGRPDHFRAIVARYRPRPPAEAYLRLRTLPGEQGQVDWGSFGKVKIGRAVRLLSAFVMVLSFSRYLFLRFYYDQVMSSFLSGHADAFGFFQGVPRVLLYDNLKSCVLERQGDAIRFHPTLLGFAGHYHYEPRPVAVARGNEKGRVERAIQYVRRAFFAAREFGDLDDLNAQALSFCEGLSAQRLCPEDRTRTVADVFAQEHPHLLSLPDNPYPTDELVDVSVGKTPYVRFDKNDYSVPHTLVQRTLCVVASKTTVRILEGNQVVATHSRTYDKDQQVEDPSHVQALVEHKHNAQQHRGCNHLVARVPQCQTLLQRLAERGDNLGSATAALLRLLAHYGQSEMEAALAEALAHKAPHPRSVRYILERRARERGQLPSLPVPLPDNPSVKSLCVVPHALRTYDTLTQESDDDDTLF